MDRVTFLKSFKFDPKGYTGICDSYKRIKQNDFDFVESLTVQLPDDADLYFTPAQFKRDGKGVKEDVLGSKFLWIDIDNKAHVQHAFPPTYEVFSGGGWHFYWELDKPLTNREQIEELNQILIATVDTADASAWNANRWLRIPNSVNTKRAQIVKVVLKKHRKITYTAADFKVLAKLNKKTRHKIAAGDTRGYPSRSERDQACITALVKAKASTRLITQLFEWAKIGDKYRDPETPKGYLTRSIKTARDYIKDVSANLSDSGLNQDAQGYYVIYKDRRVSLSTFTLEVDYLLDGSLDNVEDILICTVTANGSVWHNVPFTRSAFTSLKQFDNACRNVYWQWLGSENNLRALLPYLLKTSDPKVITSVNATGLYEFGDSWVFCGTDSIVTADKVYRLYEHTLTWAVNQREHYDTRFLDIERTYDKSAIADVIIRLNNPNVIWPMIGWYFSTMLKPMYKSFGERFPHLNVAGTTGSGKTTLITKVFQPLIGIGTPKTYDAVTTAFVKLALFGSSNAIPVAFSEFRHAHVKDFIRYILLSYDVAMESRGRADQTTVQYPLIAPFTIDGEDIVDDPAARQRIVCVKLAANTVHGNSKYNQAFREFEQLDLEGFALDYLQWLLKHIDASTLRKRFNAWVKQIRKSIPNLPDRITNNFAIVSVGIELFCEFCGIDKPDIIEILPLTIRNVYNFDNKRPRLVADSFIEEVVNAIRDGTSRFAHSAKFGKHIAAFQAVTAHQWWQARTRSRGSSAMGYDAIMSQLRETEYYLGVGMAKDRIMLKIDLKLAQKFGLDIPSTIEIDPYKYEY